MSGCRDWCRGPTPPKIDLLEASLASAWDLRNVAGVVPDLVGDVDGTPLGGSTFVNNFWGEGRQFSGGAISFGDQITFKTDTFTFSTWVLPSSTVTSTVGLLSSAAPHWHVSLATNGRVLFSTANASGTQSALYTSNNTIIAGLLYHLVATVSTEGSNVRKRIYLNGELAAEVELTDGWYATYSTNYYLGGYDSSIVFDGFLSKPKFYTVEKDGIWVLADYKSGSNGQFRFGKFDSSPLISSGQIPYAPVRVTTGTYHTEPPNELICDSSGKFVIPLGYASPYRLQNAYGVWEFEYLKATSAFNSFIAVISVDENHNSSGNYWFTILTTGAIRLITTGAGVLFESQPGVITDSYSKIKLVRRYNGEFSVYVNDVMLPAVTGSNPVVNNTYFVARYFVFFGLVGDRIRNLSKRHLP